MGKLRDQMEADLKLAGYSDLTRKIYLNHAKTFAAHFHRSPEEMGADEIRTYMVHLIEVRKVSNSTYVQVKASLGFLYRQVLRRPLDIDWLPVRKKPVRRPQILAGSEVLDLLATVRNVKYHLALMVMYGGGLRISEACSLRAGDIDAKRMTIRVQAGKGNKDRYTVLPQYLLNELEAYGLSIRSSEDYLFPGQDPLKPLPRRTLWAVFGAALKDTPITKAVSPHGLRHAFATHSLESGIDIGVLKDLLGHAHLSSTEIYVQVSRRQISRITSPLDLLHQPGPGGDILG